MNKLERLKTCLLPADQCLTETSDNKKRIRPCFPVGGLLSYSALLNFFAKNNSAQCCHVEKKIYSLSTLPFA